MRDVRRSALLPYAAPQVYGLVADVERYPEFLPWCTEARILRGDDREVTVTLGLSSGIARASFTTRNRLEPHRAVTMSLVDGPFDHLEGRWDFTPIADAGTRADLHVQFSTHGADRRAGTRSRVRGHLHPSRRRICAPCTSRCSVGAERIAIEVACAEAGRQTVLALEVPAGCTAGEALELSGIFARHPAIDAAACGVGIFGREVAREPRAAGGRPRRSVAPARRRSARTPAAAGARRALDERRLSRRRMNPAAAAGSAPRRA